jgi:hypothetical protein
MAGILKRINHGNTTTREIILSVSLCLCVHFSIAQTDSLKNIFLNPPESAKPWVFWYWMQAAVTREGITTDLEAMKANGIGGAYLVPIRGASNPPLVNPPAEQLSPEWWKMIRFAFEEARRLDIKLGLHASDGFATAGGPWITPELSMQKVVWNETRINGEQQFNDTLAKPQSYKYYYEDIAILAFPAIDKEGLTSQSIVPKVTTSNHTDASFLPEGKGKDTFKSDDPCWIQYEFEKPFTCRSIIISTGGNTFQAYRLKIEASDDGVNFNYITQLVPPRHGWLNYEDDATYSIKPVTAKYFRFIYNKEGTEPASEDLNDAKWKPNLKVKGIVLSSAPRIHLYEGKNGQVWRVGSETTNGMIPDSLCIPVVKIIDITNKLGPDGKLVWTVPPGNWTILRIGHTSTGRTNNTAGAAKGLECDKLNPEAVKFQYNHWFEEITKQLGSDLTSSVLKIFHVDSWECGSQNWSPVFREEFKKRQGYDLLPYLPAMAGIPVATANTSERFLYDVRKTISELVAENFYGTLAKLAHFDNVTFTGEAVAPVMVSDGMLHCKYVDVPMGEYWLNSPSHDKPVDILEAISGGHVYGHRIIQAEAFTTVRMDWSENPAMLKTLQDLNYALGINRLVFHVFALNPWPDRKPGMTLDGVGLFFQPGQTWWKPGKAWMEYTQRCQAMLQLGKPVIDLAVFTGEENPRRALSPDRFVQAIPGIFGKERVDREIIRNKNTNVPTQKVSLGLTLSSNMYNPQEWIDPLLGYTYDSFNADALINLATVKDRKIELPGGAKYSLLILPGSHQMIPDDKAMSPELAAKIFDLIKNGATVLFKEKPNHSFGLQNTSENDRKVLSVIDEIWKGKPSLISNEEKPATWTLGKGRVIEGPFTASSFAGLGIEKDFMASDSVNNPAKNIAWTHRTGKDFDIYFISNQQNKERIINLSLRVNGRIPEIWNPVTCDMREANEWNIEKDRTLLSVKLDPNGSVFVVLQHNTKKLSNRTGANWQTFKPVQPLEGAWQISFDPKSGGPAKPVLVDYLEDWSQNPDSSIRYYSGTAIYTKPFQWNSGRTKQEHVWLDLGEVANIAKCKINGIDCGTAWTAPYRIDITKAIITGENILEIEVTNTWANRLIGDHILPENKRITWTIAPYRLEGKPLLKAGILGPVKLAISH